ncbi:cucumber peeling cupredoxin-like [Diospyros lotus]|uniref:cucumber peeling cupredoxin-like n=1 Tax=Diospyros lotus TaxID=55363 RepID=UPI00224DDBB9|nr:cucumber peeling cupredoxin-like [Diospyros lotus]
MASMKMVLLGMVVVAALLQSTAAKTTHVVGDALGWVVPPSGAVAYSTWASNQTFTVGDVLVFNYATGQHDVATVTKAGFDSCNGTSPISIATDGPTNITLSAAGEHYYICTFGQHCSLGQKLAINVSASASPAPQPAAATPSPSPSPTSTATPPSPSAPTPNSPTAPSPSGSTTPPPTPSPSESTTPPPTPSPSGSTPSPSSTTAPPPPNGAPSSLAAAALPVTLLSIALALLH